MPDRPLDNQLRVDLYSKLIPGIIAADLNNGIPGGLNFWDDPVMHYDQGYLWDEMGDSPVIKNIFYAIEKEEGFDLADIDGLSDLTDPDRCPERFLYLMAESLGHPLEDNLPVETQREVVKSIIDLHKSRGTALSWEVFYRMIGYRVKPIPLWKKEIFEANEQYSQERFITATITDEFLGASGALSYTGTLANVPVKPGSFRGKIGTTFFRDNSDFMSPNFGKFIGDGIIGELNYASGEYLIALSAPAAADVYATYEHITMEYPYRAARVDLEIFLLLSGEEMGGGFDQAKLDKILSRLEVVRPIHVLVRLVVLVMDLPELLDDFVLDSLQCGPHMGKDVRPDDYRFYAADLGLFAGDRDLLADLIGLNEKRMLTDDLFSMCQVPDHLLIEFSDGQPSQYW